MPTYTIDIAQFCEAAEAAFSNSDRPTKETVGAIVKGVTYFNITPTIPAIVKHCL